MSILDSGLGRNRSVRIADDSVQALGSVVLDFPDGGLGGSSDRSFGGSAHVTGCSLVISSMGLLEMISNVYNLLYQS